MSSAPLIATRLRELRTRHQLTQEEAAELIGVSMRFYQHIESGRKKQIWLETVETLAAAFGLKAWELIGPQLPPHTSIPRLVAESKIHYRSRRGPYSKNKT